MGTTVEMLGSGSAPNGECRAVGDSPNDGGPPCGGCCSGDDRRRLYGENAGSSHSGCGWSVNGGGMLSGARGVEKSTFAGGRLRRASSEERVRCADALDCSALRDASVGYGPALSGVIGLDPGPRVRAANGGRLRVSSGPCSPGGRPGRGVARYISGGSIADVGGGAGKPCEGLRQAGSSRRPRLLEPGIPGPAS